MVWKTVASVLQVNRKFVAVDFSDKARLVCDRGAILFIVSSRGEEIVREVRREQNNSGHVVDVPIHSHKWERSWAAAFNMCSAIASLDSNGNGFMLVWLDKKPCVVDDVIGCTRVDVEKILYRLFGEVAGFLRSECFGYRSVARSNYDFGGLCKCFEQVLGLHELGVGLLELILCFFELSLGFFEVLISIHEFGSEILAHCVVEPSHMGGDTILALLSFLVGTAGLSKVEFVDQCSRVCGDFYKVVPTRERPSSGHKISNHFGVLDIAHLALIRAKLNLGHYFSFPTGVGKGDSEFGDVILGPEGEGDTGVTHFICQVIQVVRQTSQRFLEDFVMLFREEAENFLSPSFRSDESIGYQRPTVAIKLEGVINDRYFEGMFILIGVDLGALGGIPLCIAGLHILELGFDDGAELWILAAVWILEVAKLLHVVSATDTSIREYERAFHGWLPAPSFVKNATVDT